MPSGDNRVQWAHTLFNVVLHQDSFANALGLDGAALMAPVSHAARNEVSSASHSLWRGVYEGMSREELERVYRLALAAGESAHVARVLHAARNFHTGDCRAELLLQKDQDDLSCLFACTKRNDIATARVLLEAALDARVLERLAMQLSIGDASSIEECVFEEYEEMLELIISSVAAAKRTRVDGAPENVCMSWLLRFDMSNGMIEQGNCLFFAAKHAGSRMLEMLLEAARAEGILRDLLYAKCFSNSTCLHAAADSMRLENVQMLLAVALEADVQSQLVNAVDSEGSSCLHRAVANEYNEEEIEVSEVARTLLAAGGSALAMLKLRNSGKTALHIAVQRSDRHSTRVLLDVGGAALLMETSNCGISPLHEAAQNERDGLFEDLLRFAKHLGIGVLQEALLQTNQDGRNCLMIAVENRFIEYTRLALAYAREAGVEQQMLITEDDQGLTCLYDAVKDSEPRTLAVLAELLLSPHVHQLASLRRLSEARRHGSAPALRALVEALGGGGLGVSGGLATRRELWF